MTENSEFSSTQHANKSGKGIKRKSYSGVIASLPGKVLQNLVAVMIAFLSTSVALVQYQSEIIQMRVMGLRSEHLAEMVRLVNEWNYFQAKNTRALTTTLAADLLPERKSSFRESVERYNQEKQAIKGQAIERQSSIDSISMHIIDYAKLRSRLLMLGVFLQISIGLASISLLLRQNWGYLVVIGLSTFSILVAVITVIANLFSGML